MKLGTLVFEPIQEHDSLVAPVVSHEVYSQKIAGDVFVAKIDPELADTATFCDVYGIELGVSTNCIIVEAKRGDTIWHVACLILATDMIDVNGIVRRHVGARKTSFAQKETALQLTCMEYGGITPLGLPDSWTILVDTSVLEKEIVVIGGGIRGSKIALKTSVFRQLAHAQILNIKKS